MNYTTKGISIRKDMIIDLFSDFSNTILDSCSTSFRAILIEKGSFILKLQERKYFVESPAILCIHSEDILKIRNLSEISVKTIYFKPTVVNSIFNESFIKSIKWDLLTQTEQQDIYYLLPFLEVNRSVYVKLGPASLNRIKQLFTRLDQELSEQPDGFWPCRSRSLFQEFLFFLTCILTRYEEFKNDINDTSESFQEILVYLHNHYNDDITLSNLAARFNTNRTSLNSMFQRSTGKTVKAYLIQLRIKLACMILRDTTIPIKEIVYRTGFNDLTHFGRTFKKLMNYSPGQYREKYNWMLN